MGTRIGIKAALLAPLLLLGVSGMVRMGRRPDPLPQPHRQEVGGIVLSEHASAMPTASARPRKPYPFKDPSVGHPEAAVRTWAVLESMHVTLDVQDEPIPTILETLSLVTGLSLVPGAGLEDNPISIHIQDMPADSVLRIMLHPRKCDYEILADGTIRVDVGDKVSGGYEQVGRRAMLSLQELAQVRKELNAGWDGLARTDSTGMMEEFVRAKRVVTIQGETSLSEEISRLSRLDIPIQVAHDDEPDVVELITRPFLQVSAEWSLADRLQNLARTHGMVVVPYYFSMLFAKEEHVARYREEVAEPLQKHQCLLQILQIPVERSGTIDVPEFLDSVGRSHGLDVLPTEGAWNSAATLSLPAGTTLRQALGQLKRHGLRWAARDDKLYILK